MELYIFGRFHARAGNEAAVAEVINDVLVPTRAEAACISVHAFRSIRDCFMSAMAVRKERSSWARCW